MKKLFDEFIDNMKQNVPGFIAVSVTEIESGVSYCSYSAKEGYDPSLASAYNLEVVKSKIKAIEALGLTNETIEDMTIQLTNQLHIINIAKSGAYFIYLAVDSEKANLGITRALLNKYKAEINSIL